MHVVKLGGSLLKAPEELRAWLHAITEAGSGRVVVVPGGGPFADAVRRAQTDHRFNDRAAHRMALLGMDQCGLLLASLERCLVPSDTLAAMQAVLRGGGVPIWMPHRVAVDAEDLPASWEVTSDSLSAWLARKLEASTLWLVKSCVVPVQRPMQLAEMGIVDAAFPRFCEHAKFRIHVLGIGDRSRLIASLAEEAINRVSAAAPSSTASSRQ